MRRDEQLEREEILKRQARVEARQDMAALLATSSGQRLLSYLFSILKVGTLPDEGLLHEFLRFELGALKTGQELYKLASEADPHKTALILSQLERDRHVNSEE